MLYIYTLFICHYRVSGEFAYHCYLFAFLAGFFTYAIRFHYRMNEGQVLIK